MDRKMDGYNSPLLFERSAMMLRLPLILCLMITLLIPAFATRSFAQSPSQRDSRGLVALYDFTEGSGATVHDRSGFGAVLDLTIDKVDSVNWSSDTLTIKQSVGIVSQQPARKIVDAVRKSNAISIEAWLKPANTKQAGPARIVSISKDSGARNVTLGQDGDLFDIRLRASGTSTNGIPSTGSPKKSLQSQLTHVVYTRDASGTTTVYLDGKQASQGKASGNVGNWDTNHRLSLANEITGDRPWLGELHMVAIFDRALAAGDVQRNFAAGPKAGSQSAEERAAEMRLASQHTVFNRTIAPLFAEHCIECHDPAVRKGGLDLSRKTAALAGGESGKVLTPGKAADSLLWESVANNEMPKSRPPLSAEEKAILRKWLDDGAVWPVEVIDPAIYLHEGHAGEVWVQRLTVPEYIETVRSSVGVDIAADAREILPPDLRADGFSNTAYNLSVDLKLVEAYSKLAQLIVSRMDVLQFAGRFSKSRKLSTDDTMRDQVSAMGKWLFRGPLDPKEVNDYSGIATTVASASGDFKDAMSYIVEAMLQSPRFVYRIENQHGGSPRPVGQYELASRLSYIIWGGPPDESLYRAADKNELADRGKLQAQVDRMMQDPRAVVRSLLFVSEWLNLGRLSNLQPNRERFPNWNAELASDMREETLAFFKEVVWTQKRPLAELLSAQVTFATPRLATHYGLKPAGKDMSRYDLSSVPGRGGLLTQGSVLTIGGDNASMVSRGLFVLHDLLRGTVNAPPPCVNVVPPPTKAGLTQRGIAEGRVANEQCGVCHVRFEPLAYGLEKFDGIGAYHDKDNHGNKLRDDGEVLFPGEAKSVQYNSAAELMNLLAASERVQESLTWKVTQFALGRPLVASDAPTVTTIHKSAQQNGGTYSALLTAIVLSDLVQTTRIQE